MSLAEEVRALIIDMDGVLWRGQTLLEGVKEFFQFMRSAQLRFVLASNNSAAALEQVAERLGSVGVTIRAEEFLTTAEACAGYLTRHLAAGAPVYVIGERALREAITQAGFAVLETSDGVEAVVVGLDFHVTWQKLSEAALALARGVLFVGANPDPSFPIERGMAIGNGALLAALQVTTGCSPVLIGKPEPHLFLEALGRLQTRPENTMVVGDRLETDILGGQRAGLRTALLLTGVTQAKDLQGSTVKPDWVFESLHALRRALEGS
jgi:4-nitrophenyl phosphatase